MIIEIQRQMWGRSLMWGHYASGAEGVEGFRRIKGELRSA